MHDTQSVPQQVISAPPIALRTAIRGFWLLMGATLVVTGLASLQATEARRALASDPVATDMAVAVVALWLLSKLLRPLSGPRFLHQSALVATGQAILWTAFPFAFTLLLTAATGRLSEPLMDWQLNWAAQAVPWAAALRVMALLLFRHWDALGNFREAIIVVGSGPLAARLIDWLQTHCANSVEILGVYDDRRRADGIVKAAVCGTVEDLLAQAGKVRIDRIIVALPHSSEHRVLAILGKLKRVPVDICLGPDNVGYAIPTSRADFAGLPVLTVFRRPLDFEQRLIKAVFDRVAAALALVVLSPLLLATAIAIKLDSPGPVFFRQPRYGFANRVINVTKFRTMRAEMCDSTCRQQTQHDDKRLTRVGRFLRKSSIDELPQLLNILKGEMSIVGPRPMATGMRVRDRRNDEIVRDYADRHRVKPGLTGWAQVNGYRGAIATPEELSRRVACDLHYIDHYSLWLDIKIIAMTIKVCIGHANAF